MSELGRKPKSQRSKRALEKRAPKVVETIKSALFLRGSKTSQVVTAVLKDLYELKKPNAVMFQRNNQVRPFEDTSSMEFFAKKNDTSLFVMGTHSKKRPHNLIFGRMYDHQLLHMLEVGISNTKTIRDFKTKNRPGEGFKPCFIFQGDGFVHNEVMKTFQSVLLDTFRGRVVEEINLVGLDHVIVCTAVTNEKMTFRHYAVLLKKSGQKLPRVELEEVGPRFDADIRRHKFASHDLQKQAVRYHQQAKPKKKRNVSTNVFGESVGRIHMQKQDLNQMALRKMKGLKRGRDEKKEEASEGGEEESNGKKARIEE